MNIKTIIIIPIIFIVILSATLTNFLVSFEEKVFINQSKEIENKIILEQKHNTKNNINNIITILNHKSESFITLQKEIIKERTSNAIQLIDNIYKNNQNLSKNDIFAKIKQDLNFISSTDTSKYYYIYKMDGTCVSVPANRKLEGKNLLNLQDIKGQYVIKTMIKIASKGGGFNEWYYLNPKTKNIEKKIGYAIEYKPLNIFIGTAIYEQNIIDNIKKFSSTLLNDFKTTHGGYVFAYDDKGNTIAHIKKSLIGVNRWDLKKNGKYLLREVIHKGQIKGGSFVEYEATINPKTKKPANKISFLNEFKKLKWVIGTGFYTDDLYNDIKISQAKLKIEFERELQTIIFSTIIVTLILIIVLWIILNKVSSKLTYYRKELETNNDKLNDLNINLENKVVEKTKDLNENLDFVNDLLDSSLQGITISDLKGICVGVNNSTLEILSYKHKNDIVNKNIFEFICDSSKDLVKHNILNNYTQAYEINLIDSNNKDVPVLIKGKTVKHKNKELRITTFVSLVDLKKKEKLLYEQAKLSSMGEMIGNIAHQWRQPLSVISTASTGMQMQKEFGKLSDEIFNKNCEAINENAQYLSKTIDDFRNFIKGDRKKMIFKLSNEITSFLHLIDGSIKNHNINLILDLDDTIELNSYENELTQCMINIFNNAKDVLKEKEEDNRFIFISTYLEDDKVIIKIKDSGGGIAQNVLPKIFEPYFTTKHKSQGTGLGLHMSYNLIVDGMNGTIEANNVEFKYDEKKYVGAEFTIALSLS